MNSLTQTSTSEMSLKQALNLWFSVPKRQPSHRDREILAQAEHFELPFGKIALVVSSWGQGPPVVLVHGWGGHRGQFSAFVAPLVAANFRVVAFDAPAHGDTLGTQTNGFEIAAALDTVLQRVGEPQAILAHSLATVVVTIALQNGLRVEKLVFFGALRRLADALTAFAHSAGFSPEIREKVYQRMRDLFGADIWEKTALDVQLPRFPIPTRLFHDREDEITPYRSSVALAQAWSSAELVSTRGFGHRRILKNPQVIQSSVAFLSS